MQPISLFRAAPQQGATSAACAPVRVLFGRACLLPIVFFIHHPLHTKNTAYIHFQGCSQDDVAPADCVVVGGLSGRACPLPLSFFLILRAVEGLEL
eukprot:1136726-Pelagomonas_calceolata.AAC.2